MGSSEGFRPFIPDIFSYTLTLGDRETGKPILAKDIAAVELNMVSKWVARSYSFELKDVSLHED